MFGNLKCLEYKERLRRKNTFLLIENTHTSGTKISYQNKNFLDKKGCLHNIYIGDQNSGTITKTWEELVKITEKLRRKGKRVLILAETIRLGKINLAVRKIGLQMIQNLDYDKAAIVGTNLLYERLVKNIILVSGRGFKVQYFTKEVEAKRWLLSSSQL